MDNPRKNPIELNDIACGQHAISMGAQQLGKMLAKCLTEASTIASLPPGPQTIGVAKILRMNLQRIMGTLVIDD